LGVLLLGLTPYPRAFAGAMRQAEALCGTRAYAAALKTYALASRLDPVSPLPWLHRGQILLDQRRFPEATAAFLEAERLGGGVAALLGLGESYAGRGDWAAAIPVWLRAQVVAPGDARPLVALGQGMVAQGRFDEARAYLAAALQREPGPIEAAPTQALLGRLALEDDPAQAAGHFRQAGDEDMLAVLAVAEAEADPARRALLLGVAFLQRDELPLARHHLERALALDAASVETRAYLAHTLDRQGETAAAGALLAEALALDPESVLVRYFLGTHHLQVGNVERAQAELWPALVRDPENAALRVAMAEAFLALGDYATAEEWYRGAVEVAPEDLDFHLALVHFYLDHIYRIEERGVPAAEAAAALAPADARTQDLLGWAYHLAGRYTEGTRALERALALDPDLVSALYHLGSLYATVGRRDLAREYLSRAADLDTGGYYRQRAERMLAEIE